MGKKFSLSIGFVFALVGVLFLGFAQFSKAAILPTGGTIQNETPAFTAGPSDGGSSATTPTLVGANVTFTATATDANGEQYYLAACKTNSATAGNDAAPTCPGGSWAISAATNSASQASVTYTALLADATTNAWYAFVCDKVVGGGVCSSSSQGSGDSGSPFVVNHVPTQSTPSTRAHAFLDANSVGYWQFEDGTGVTAFDDQTTNSNNASCVGSTCPTWTQEGAVGSGYQFDGTEDFITGSSLTPQLTGDVTLSTWFKMSTLPSLQTRIIDLQQAAAAGLQLCISPTGVVLIDNSGGPSAGIATSGSFVDGVWHHAVTTREGTTYKLYVDGVYINSSSGTAPTYTKIQMAKESGVYFNGFIDEPHVYSRALSATEILNLYNSTTYAFNTHDLGVGARTLADADSNALVCSVDWRKNGTSAAVLNMSFNKNVTATTTGAVPDYSSYANNGTLGGGTAANVPTWTSAATCANNSGGCYSFDGTNDYIALSSSMSQLEGANSYTLSSWVKHGAMDSSEDEIFHQGSDGNHEIRLVLNATTCYPGIATYEGGYGNVSGSASICDSNWHHVVAVKNGTTGTLYVDGSQVGTGTVNNVVSTTIATIGAIRDTFGGGRTLLFFGGLIDEVQLYSRALSSAQISAMYNAAKPNYQNFVNNETAIGDLWSSSLTCADTYGVESSTSASNSVEILGFTADVSDGGSYSGAPTSVGSNVTFTGTFNAPSSRQWYLAVCKTNAVTAGNNAAPTCDGGSWAISSEIADGASSSTAVTPATYTALITDAESNAWYAFACDKVASVATCSPVTQGSGSNGSPFAVNHRPAIGTVKIGETCDTTTSVDPGNSANAKVTTVIGSSNEGVISSVLQSDGKLVTTGYSSNGSNNDFALARYNVDGTLDTTFNTTGKVTTAIGSGDDTPRSVVIQSDGKIVVAGWSSNGSNLDFAIARYTTAGALDTSFNSTGKVTTLIGSGDDAALSVAIQSDGKIVAAGYSRIGTTDDFAVVRYNADGSLDTGFDGDGKMTTPIGSSEDQAYSVAIQSDGKIVTAGSVWNGTNYDFALARYTTAGALDTTFNSTGMVTTAIGSGDEVARSLVLQADGKVVAAGYSSNGSNLDFALVRYSTAGGLDTSFDTDGKQTTVIGSGEDFANSVALQPDGKIVLVGWSHNGTDYDFALARYTTTGALDPAFDTDGKLTTAIGSGNDLASYVSLQTDGKIVVTGTSHNGINYDYALVRYTTVGALDSLSGYACAQAGVTESDNSDTVAMHVCSTNSFTGSACAATTYCSITGVKTGGSAQCVMDGRVPVPTAHGTVNAYVFLVDSRGLVDAGTANTQSYSVTDTAPYIVDSSAYSVSAIALVAGNSTAKSYTVTVKDDNGDTDLTGATGALYDSSFVNTPFDTDGMLNTDFASTADIAKAMALQSDGKIVAAGYSSGGYQDFGLVRYNTDGSLDTSFDTDGKQTTAMGGDHDNIQSIAIQSDGKIVAAGRVWQVGLGYDFALARYTTAGALDTTFSGDGMLTTDFGSGSDQANSVALQSDGKIVVAGSASNGANNDFALARYNADGTLDTTFSGDGKVTTAIGSQSRANSVALQSDGKIVVAGAANVGAYWYFALTRYNENGSLDTSFDTDGIVTTDFGTTDNEVLSVAIQSDGKIVVAGANYDGIDYDFALARYTTAGALDTSFDTDGKQTTAIGSGDDQITSVALQTDGKIVVAGYAMGSNNDFAVARYTTAGALDTSFSTDGKLTTDSGSANNVAYAVAIQADAKIVVAGNSYVSNDDFTLMRYNTDGTLDNSASLLVDGTCPAYEANCYSGVTCALSANTSGTDNQATATCDFTVWFNANYSSGWKMHANPVDGQGAVTTQADSAAVATNSLQGINITQTEIAYGGLALGATSSGILTTLQNMGNQVIDTLIQGTDMAGTPSGSIAASQQKWHNTIQDFAYASVGNVLVTDAAGATTKALGCADRNIAVRSDHALGTNSDESMYWKLQIPSSKPAGTYAGTNTFVASASTQCSDGE